MAVKLPNGVTLALGSSLGSAVAITALSNANPAVATAMGHGYSDNDIVLLTSGWGRINERVFKVDQLSADTFSLLGQNTTDTTVYPAGTGTGSAKEVTAWTQITQVTGLTSSGGEMQFANYSFLEEDFERQLPTQSSAQTLTLTIADDPSLTGYTALKAAADSRSLTPMRALLPDGSMILYAGIVSFNETPTMTKNEVMSVTATFSLQGRPVRYSA